MLWAGLFAATWASWGSLTVDSGREMYVPATLVKGQTLYRDVWYPYGPLAPYFNSFLFRLLAVRLEVLYWAGSLSALGSAVFLYLAGMRLSSWLAGWTAGAVVTLQAFVPGIFCFPLPYSFAAVYGCFVACLLLWLGLRSMESGSVAWILAAGASACVALLLKLEYGFACYAFLSLLIVVRAWRHRSGKLLLLDLAAVLPGIVVCAFVIDWMISLRGVEFITQDNFMSWPTSYFMRTYGKRWLGMSGASIAGTKAEAIWSTAALVALVLFIHQILRHGPRAQRYFFPVSVALVTLVTALVGLLPGFTSFRVETVLRAIFFPRAMVFLVAVGVGLTLWLVWRRRLSAGAIRLALVSAFSFLLASRMLLSTYPLGYSIYYDGPAVLSLLLIGQVVAPAVGRPSQFRRQWELLLCFGCLAAVSITVAKHAPGTADWVPLKTERGTIRAPQRLVATYAAALDFMKKRAAHGEYVLSLPEDTSLYFLSGTQCPSRVYAFTPGMLVPGRMTEEVIRDLESKPVRYLLWSNRRFRDYGVPVFGKDYDQFFGDYLRAHYRPLRSLAPAGRADWSVVIWEQVPRGESP